MFNTISAELIIDIENLIKDRDITITEITNSSVTLSNGSKIITQPNDCLLGVYPETDFMAFDSINVEDFGDLHIYIRDWF